MVTKDQLRVITSEINAALAVIAAKHKINLRVGNTSFTSTEFTTKVHGSSTQTAKPIVVKDNSELLHKFFKVIGKNSMYQVVAVNGDNATIVPTRGSKRYTVTIDRLLSGKEFTLVA